METSVFSVGRSLSWAAILSARRRNSFSMPSSVCESSQSTAATMPTNLFLRDLHPAADAVVRIVAPDRGGDEVLLAEKQAGVLRTADTLAAGKRDEVEAHLGVIPEIGNRRHVGGGVVEGRDVVGVGHADPVFAADLALLGGIEEMGHHGAVVEGRFVLLQGLDFDHFDAGAEHGVVIAVAVGLLNDDLVLEVGDFVGDRGFRTCWRP